MGVGELSGGPARVGEVQEEVVEDEEAAGADGGSRGGLNQRRRLRRLTGLRREIAGLRWTMWTGEEWRRSSEGRGAGLVW